jgi:argininosuccinate lyase
MTGSAPHAIARSREFWRRIAQVVSAHVVMLSDVGLVDDGTRDTLLAAIDRVAGGDPPDATFATLVARFDDRLDAQTPAGISGAARVGRATADTVATALRLVLRDRLLDLGDALDAARRAALELASIHATTLMPAYVGGKPAQPTTFGHFLGGLIGPLGRAAANLPPVYADVNRSSLGAGTFTSTGMPIDRERAAELLGFDGLVVNTFDAVSSIDDVVASADVAAGIATAISRFLVEISTWLRTEPGSFRFVDAWTADTPEMPQLLLPVRLDALLAHTREVTLEAHAVRHASSDLAYGPIAWTADIVWNHLDAAFTACLNVLSETTTLLAADLDVNRAHLANRAGRNHTTSSDLADFLMIEEQLDPDTAFAIASRTIARVIADGIEVSGITPEIIDSVALLTIGRELKVEFESISRYLAPRRFLERRTATGAPSPAATRAYLDQELLRLGTDLRWRTGARERLVAAPLRQAIDEALTRPVLG